jgi:hypothetical protein
MRLQYFAMRYVDKPKRRRTGLSVHCLWSREPRRERLDEKATLYTKALARSVAFFLRPPRDHNPFDSTVCHKFYMPLQMFLALETCM